MKWWGAAAVPMLGLAMAGAWAANDPQGYNPNGWGYDMSAIDSAVRPGDGFDAYANGAWKTRVVIPAERAGWSIASVGQEETLLQLRGILEQAEGADGAARPVATIGKVGAFYASYMDQARIDALGAKPLAGDLAAITDAGTRDDLAALMGRNVDGFHGDPATALLLARQRRCHQL